MNLGQYIIIGLSVFLVLWYIGANSFNRQRGIATYRWLRRGLDPKGEISETRWLGSSGTGARLAIPQAQRPFRRLEAVFLLETREILPYWILSHLWGRRDGLTIKADLHRPPQVELAVQRIQEKGSPSALSVDQGSSGLAEPLTAKYKVVRAGQEEGQISPSLVAFLTASGDSVQSLFLHAASPHFELNTSIKPLLIIPPETFFSSLEGWLREQAG